MSWFWAGQIISGFLILGWAGVRILQQIRAIRQDERDYFGRMILTVDDLLTESGWTFAGSDVKPRVRGRTEARAWWEKDGVGGVYTIELVLDEDGVGHVSSPEIDEMIATGNGHLR